MKTPEFDLPKGISLHGGSLRISFREPGKKYQRRISLGIAPTKKNIKAAEMKLAAIKLDVAIGAFDMAKYFPDHVSTKQNVVTIGQVMEKYYRQDAIKRSLSKGTLDDVEVHMNVIASTVANVDLHALRRADADSVYERLLDGTTQQQALRIMKKIKTATRRAAAAELLDRNPFEFATAAAKLPPKILAPEDVFSIEEANDMIAMATNIRQELGNVIAFAFWSGARPGEIAALRKSDVDLPFINIDKSMQTDGNVKRPKTRAGIRRIHLPQRAIEAVKSQLTLHDGPHLFSKNYGEPFDTNILVHQKTWRKICNAVAKRELPRYRTRHSFISWMINAGEKSLKVANHVGHKDTKMIDTVYVRFIPDKEPSWALDKA